MSDQEMLAVVIIKPRPAGSVGFEYRWLPQENMGTVLRELVGGYFEAVHLGRNQIMWVCEEGLRFGHLFNNLASLVSAAERGHSHMSIVGTAVIMGFDAEGENVSVSTELVLRVAKMALALQ